MRIVLAFLFLVILPKASALQGVALDMASMKAPGWTLEGIHIALTDIEPGRLKLILTINKFTLPQPFNELNLARIRCDVFGWQNNELWCKQGRAKVGFGQGQATSANFSFRISEKKSSFQIKELLLAGGTITVEGVARGDDWQLHVQAAGLDGKLVQQLLKIGLFDIKTGNIDLDLQASGHKARLSDFNLTVGLKELTLQAKEGQWASENLSVTARVFAQNQEGVWRWRNQSRFTGGGLFVDPIYLEPGENAIQWEAEGTWNGASQQAEIKSVHFRHDHTGEGTGTATIRLKEGVSLEKAELSVSSQDLQRLSSVYLKPFLEETPWAGVSMDGSLNAHIDLNRNTLTGCSVSFRGLDIKDAEGRVGVSGGFGTFNWSRLETAPQSSRLAWRRLQLGALPIGAANLSFLTQVNTIRLLEKAKLPFLGGAIAINRFFLVADKSQEPEIYFEGNINNVSLEQLSHALNWTPLSGTVSGRIPGVEYRNHTLKLGGELLVRVFDGVVKVAGLALSGLFSDLPTLTAEITIDHLDMDQITRRFEFGGITGRISGFIKNLVMENWKPISFYAWLGTPEDDDSRHRISQKAVKNIASIGGGGATDLVSRSFLSLFETFGYDKLGLGCYLHQGVCQLMGLEPTESREGYYIIKGGGLPRIDVIGYNSKIDWNVLIERLKRITSSDEVIVQ
jgi:hypothetical protein